MSEQQDADAQDTPEQARRRENLQLTETGRHLSYTSPRDWRTRSSNVSVSPGPGFRRLHKVVGAEGFEPSNTGSKVPRLTAWPRPIERARTALRGATTVAQNLDFSRPDGRRQAGPRCS